MSKRIRINVDDEANEDWLKNDEEREIAAAVAAEFSKKGKDGDKSRDIAISDIVGQAIALAQLSEYAIVHDVFHDGNGLYMIVSDQGKLWRVELAVSADGVSV